MKKFVAFLILSLLVFGSCAFGTFQWVAGTERKSQDNDRLVLELRDKVQALDVEDVVDSDEYIVGSQFDEVRVRSDRLSFVEAMSSLGEWDTDSEYRSVRGSFMDKCVQSDCVLLPDTDMTGLSVRYDVVDFRVMSIEDDTYSYLADVFMYVVDRDGSLKSMDAIVLFDSGPDQNLLNFEAY
ncbi:MAG: hypothetical protein HDQ88_09595 [Clostridia bacterium]|nr:hypothetical protein [Clostridia bacterium]